MLLGEEYSAKICIILEYKKFSIIFAKIMPKKGDKNYESRKKSYRFPRIKSKKYVNFRHKLGKLAVQLEDEYYKNGKSAHRFTIIFC